MNNIQGGVTAAKGFRAASAAAHIKSKSREDMAMIVSDVPCVTAGTFTKNIVKAAPVLWDRAIVQNRKTAQAVVINSGIANACTGEAGMQVCEKTAARAAGLLHIGTEDVLVASTGVIGMQIPMERILDGIDQMQPRLDGSQQAGTKAARAIMTTDTRPKEAAVQVRLGGKLVTIGGMCKGSGMIHPDMCTMLSFVTTDAAISQELLSEALSADIIDTYHMISVDGDTSTNDTVLLLANGQAGNAAITQKNDDYTKFCKALHRVNEALAKQIAGDGEGATALLEAIVMGAATKEQARMLSKSVICSNLTKAAVFGHDANWGRVLCAMGYSGAEFNPEKVDLYFESDAGRIQIMKAGIACDYSEDEATRILSQEAVTILADIHEGHERAAAWGCDLTYDYIRINADYRS